MLQKIWEKLWSTKLFQTKLFQNNILQQFLRFGIVGVSNTVLSYILYLIFLYVFEKNKLFPDADYLISSVLTFCICVVWSFYWNNRFTFKKEYDEQRNILRTFVKTTISYSFTGLFLHNALLYVLVKWCHLPKQIVPLLNLFVTVPLNFLLNKYWAFGRKSDASDDMKTEAE